MGKLIVFEGIDRSGKTTQISRLYEYLKTLDIKFFTTREPNDPRVRDFLKANNIPPEGQLDLILRDRYQHTCLLRSMLEDSELVLCDRYTGSTLAYQGHGHGMDIERLESLNKKASQGIEADVTILFDCPVDVALRRNPGKSLDKIETDPLFLDRVRYGYLELAKKYNWAVVDASQSECVVFEEVLQILGTAVPLKEFLRTG